MHDKPGAVPAAAGIGLRFQHHGVLLEMQPNVAWLEVHTENYMGGGPSIRTLEAVRSHYPLSLHGVGLSLGSADGLDQAHLERVAQVVRRTEPGLVSEHLSWSVVEQTYLADLLPLPMTEEALDVVCRNVDHMQTLLGRQILLENPSSYLQYMHSTIPEGEFLSSVASRTGCGILCDINNIYVSCFNHGWDADAYLEALPPSAVREIHLAGHTLKELDGGQSLRIDDHGSEVAPAVWDLYGLALARFGPVPTLIEWDTDIPVLQVLLAEAAKAAVMLRKAQHHAFTA